MDLRTLGCAADSEETDMDQEQEARRRNVDLQLRKWQESEEFENKIDAIFAKKMEGQVSVQEEQREAMEKDFGGQLEQGSDEHVVALIEETAPRITMRTIAPLAPSSYHQTTSYVSTSALPWHKRFAFLFWSTAVVLFQLGIAGAVLFGTSRPSCLANENCPVGTWCTGNYKDINRCVPCKSSYAGFCMLDTDVENEVAWEATKATFFSKPDDLDRVEVCDGCVDSNKLWDWDLAQEHNVKVMNALDWAVYVFAVILTAMAVVYETRDIMLCKIALYAATEYQGCCSCAGWTHVWIEFLAILRNFIFLPLSVYAIAQTVFVWGTQPLTIILNTLAVLFAVLLNPLFYKFLVSDIIKTEVEEFGRMKINVSNSRLLSFSKVAYMYSIPAVLIAKVALYDYMTENDFSSKWIQSGYEYPYGLEITFYAFLLAPFVETIWLMFVNRKPLEVFWVIVRVVGGWLLLQYYMFWLFRYYYRPKL